MLQDILNGTVINSQVSGDSYRILDLLGAGGFGKAYKACLINRDGSDSPRSVCLKITEHSRAWHGEAFYGDLLKSNSHVVRQLDSFPTMMPQGRVTRIVFVIVMEFIESGTVRDACDDGRLPWTEDQVARRIRGLLNPLALLHNMGTSHRDITPGNVFIANRAVLKLGDFGITSTGFTKLGVRANALTRVFAPRDLISFWRPADDVYQVGLLMLTLLSGSEIENSAKKADVTALTSSQFGLREAIKSAISIKSARPQTATDLLGALPRP